MEKIEEFMNDVVYLDDAAKLLVCSVRTIYRAIHEGELPAYRPGNKIVVSKADLFEWVKTERQLMPRKDKRLMNMEKVHPKVKRLMGYEKR